MNGDPKIVGEVIAFLDQSKLEHAESDQQYSTKIEVRSGAVRANLTVYNSGKIVVGGPASDIKTHLQQAADTIQSGKALAPNPLPFDIEQFPEAIQERVPECDPVIIACVSEVECSPKCCSPGGA
jgi:TATA-box binding protein (TBP) (component of TFIID and TFIIIB)